MKFLDTALGHHTKTAMIACAVAGALLVGDHELVRTKPQQLVTTAGKTLPFAWGEMSQGEINRLSDILSKLPKREVAIFCMDRNCDDLALDFDNAFETAHWTSGIERPLVDTNTGINVGPNDEDGRVLAAAIESATEGRIKPGLVQTSLIGGRMALVISKRAN